MSDRIFGVVGLLLAIGFAFAALAIEESFLSDAVGPKAFPLIIAVVLGLSSISIALKPDASPTWPSLGRFVEIVAAVVVMVLYAELLPVIGFVFATAFAATYLTWRLGSGVIASVITGIGTSVGIYAVFHLVLGLSLARGPLGF
ncbi:tripartite tricarboxylate transporter TctB family protein [Celeribacter litoreus]|uniref:tripartite tricarboxylate transporter TctB family protein n=1 Tax=Celeribacter litoreus TaxID=2876714 RepID=UPI001CCDD6BD|nr:tripartite tricarboxylate transporter TctB family protein [Celeribacter litoreus]MCA0044898.1 tripartite tricarboxylate transporter TctB family protein [Celeribacter litoreus]